MPSFRQLLNRLRAHSADDLFRRILENQLEMEV